MKQQYAYLADKNIFVRVIEDKGEQVKVLLPGRKRPTTVSKTQLADTPQRIIAYRNANFDQKCGCKAVAELEDGIVRTFNLYGSISKYVKAPAELREPLDTTPHHRRVFLKKNGFSCAKGNAPRQVGEEKGQIQDVGEYFYKKLAKSTDKAPAYKLVSVGD